MWNESNAKLLGGCLVVLWLAFWGTVIGTVIGVAWHFISKCW